MSIARPAAEIDPQSRMFSSNWILPGPIRPSGSRSIRTLREGSDFALDLGMKYLLTISFRAQRVSHRIKTKAASAFYEQTEPVTYSYEYGEFGVPGPHELSIVVFTAADRSLPAQTSSRIGAPDPDAGGKAQSRAPAAECGILRPAHDAGRIADCGGFACDGDGLWQPRRTRYLYRAADRGLAKGRRRRSCQGRRDLPSALACRPRFTLLVPA